MYISEDERTGSFTFNAEGSTDPHSRYYIGRLSHPSSGSGVTIGAGYDMGGRGEATVKRDLVSAGLDEATAGKLAKGAGLTDGNAERFVRENKASLVVNDMSVLRRLFKRTYPDYVSRARSCFQYHSNTFAWKIASRDMFVEGKNLAGATYFDWESLFPAIRVIAIDFVYQGYGRMQSGYGRPMHFCMTNNFDWIINYIANSSELMEYEEGRGRVRYLQSRKDFETGAYSQCIAGRVNI